MEPLAMNPEVRAQWTAALRSGDYRQGRGYLHRGDGTFCCLGVLCDVAVKAGAMDPPEKSSFANAWMYGEGEVAYLPESILEWAGLTYHNPSVILGNMPQSLTVFNDGQASQTDDDGNPLAYSVSPRTFSEIADLIDGIPA